MLSAYLNILIFFVLIFIGYILTAKKWFNSVVADSFSKLILTITLPIGMFVTITSSFSKAEFLSLFSGILLPFCSILLAFIVGIIVAKIFNVAPQRRGAFSAMYGASNTIFMGLPISMAIFGPKAVPYVLLYYICNTLFFWTIGIYMLAKDGQIKEGITHKVDFKKTIKQLFSPALIGFLIGLICVLIDFPKIVFIEKLGKQLSNLTTPLSMFFIGIIIYQTGISNLKMNKDTFLVLIGRFVISPLLVVSLSKFMPISGLMLKVFIVQSAMPVQNSMAILAHGYGADEKFAATSLTYSVLAYLFVIPILLYYIL
ncbi:malate transporter [Lactococcus hodotermopsidis]|uniref:Malate transporter n=1 Tax=Pseudolactococcus hodotermopsidis TaxID=2709157 RepID=A0A6A0B8X1_9LACT|nr:AEC family transporter [Lactococcus hodotermopsidis]GFH41870.1 malate transporter [Lactococcus hodotermopsidis]